MHHFKNTTRFKPVKVGEMYQQERPGKLTFLGSEFLGIYWTAPESEGQVLVAAGYHLSIDMPEGHWLVDCDGAVSVDNGTINQITYRTTSEVFASLDRPPLLTPEQAAIQKLMRANQIERDHRTWEMEKLRREVASAVATKREDPAPAVGEPLAETPAPKADAGANGTPDGDAEPENEGKPSGDQKPEPASGA